MNSTNYENQILNAIETVVNNAVNNAGYDKTIQAVILENIDSSIGKYKVKYQDSELEVYSNNPDIIYPIGTMVNILVPGNDFSQSKTIIDAIEKKDVQYTTVLEEYEKYEDISGNVITSNQEFGLCSYKVDGDKIILYDRDRDVNDINVDIISFKENLKDSDNIYCGASFQTNLANDQTIPGNFGYIIEMEFKDNISGDIITKLYQLDTNVMTGNPYNLSVYREHYKIFEIDTENFVDIKQIYIFAEDFPNSSEEITIKDIFVKDFKLKLLSSLSEEQMNEYVVSISKGDKTYFNSYDDENATIQLFATVKFKNKIVNTDINYYWFKENNGIDVSSNDYNNFGGKGWTCLNNYELIGGQAQSKMFIPTINTMTILKSDAPNAVLNVKCVAVRNDKILAEKIVSISNYAADVHLTIESNEGTLFYYDVGSPTLTCKTNSAWDKDEDNNLTYKWSMIDINGIYTILDETKEINQKYNEAVINYNALLAKIATGAVMEAASQEELNSYLAIIHNYENTQRVEGRYIHHVNISQIKTQTTFKCSVWNNDELLGTAAITLRNRLITEGEYYLNIINGDQTYIYNTMGTAPTNQSLEKTIEIQPLSFEIIDNLGGSLTRAVLNNCTVNWEVPKNSLIIAENSQDLTLPYTIADNYDVSKINNNTINLTVKYKNLTLKAKTTFNFIKEGEPGTNGSEVICKIVPNTTDENFKDYPMLVYGVPNYPLAVANKWFKVQIWKSGIKVWEGYQSDSSVTLTWSVLKNNYTSAEDPSSININDNGDFSYNSNYNTKNANIIKATVVYENNKYYSTMPIICAMYDTNNYKIKLKEGTGFRYVLYTSDGRSPQYDDTYPFTIEVQKKINGYWEDISTIENEYKVTYNWSTTGSTHNGDSWVVKPYLLIQGNATENTKVFLPSAIYDGECVNNAIHVNLKDNNSTTIGNIHIPVHLYLYRYGIAALNEWDGNKITLNDDQGAILAPQVGAGKKNNYNQFTGVLMGSVKESGSPVAEEGLFGYHNGQRTIFLDANTGKAEFGKSGKAKIILDPTSDKAQLYSGNYKEKTSTTEGSGMLIDLTTPEIKFGSGNFSVSQFGNLTAKGGGSIAGWNITNTTLSKNTVGMCSDNTQDTNIAFWAGNSALTAAPFRVNYKGELTATKATIQGAITATSLTLGSGVTVPSSKVSGLTDVIDTEINTKIPNLNKILYQGDVQHTRTTSSDGHLITDVVKFKDSSGTLQTYTTYTSTSDGYVYTNVGLGTRDSSTHANNYVRISKQGLLEADNAVIYGTIHAGAGKIAGWNITTNNLNSGSETTYVGLDSGANNTYAIWAGNVTAANAPFSVTKAGAVKATNGKIGNWSISSGAIKYNDNIYLGSDGNVKFGTKFSVNTSGEITATGGKIGGWTLTLDSLYHAYDTSVAADYKNTGMSSNKGKWAFWSGETNGKNGASGTDATFRVGHNGALYAISGKVGGWTLSDSALYTSNNNYYLGTTGITATIGGTSRSNIIFKAGDNFGVNSSGVLYANNATIKGTITSSTITGGSINIKNGSNSYFSVSTSQEVRMYNGTGYFSMGLASKHPWISGINVNQLNGVNFYTGADYSTTGSRTGYIKFYNNYSTSGMLIHSDNGLNIESTNAKIDITGYLNLAPSGQLRINGTAGANADLWTYDYQNVHIVVKNGIVTTCQGY